MTDTRENAERGAAIERRARAHGIYSARELEAMTESVGRKVARKSIGNAYAGTAGPKTYERLEDALALYEERTSSVPAVDPQELDYIEFRITGDIGVDVIVRAVGPESRAEAEASVARLIRDMKNDDPG